MSRKKFKKSKKVNNKEIDNEIVELETALKTKKWEYDFKVENKYTFDCVQQSFVETMLRYDTHMGIIDGPAGSAKTYLAVYVALKLISERKIDNIIYIRSAVESASRSIGFIPGEIEDKFAPYSMPLNDKLEELVSPEVTKNLIGSNVIRCVPVNFSRGLTFRNSLVIIDEAQNLTYGELTTLLTRFGEGSKYIVIGDTMQSDIGKNSGFPDIFKRFSGDDCDKRGIFTFTFTENQIVRHEILRFILERLKK